MDDNTLWNLIIPVLTFVASVAVIWGGMRGKLEAIPQVQKGITDALTGRINTLEETIHRRFEQTCSTCKENTKRVEYNITHAHERIDECLKEHVN